MGRATRHGDAIILLRLKRALRIRTRLRQAWRWTTRHRGGWLLLQGWWIDRRYGGYCGGIVASPFSSLGAEQTESCDYRALTRLFAHPLVAVVPADVLVDVGCGKGRVINFWLHAGFRNRIVGIELSAPVAEWTRARLARHANVEIVTGDAIELLPADGTVFFLFNPFGREVMAAFARQLLRRTDLPKLRVVYLNSRHADAFDAASWDVRTLAIGAPDPAVLIRPRR